MKNTSLSVSVPDELVGQVKFSDIYQNYNSKRVATSYGIDVDFPELSLHRTLKSTDLYALRSKVEYLLVDWELRYQRYNDKTRKADRASYVEDLNLEARHALDQLDRILTATLDVDDAVDWSSLKQDDAYSATPTELGLDASMQEYIQFNSNGKPWQFTPEQPPRRPILEDVAASYGLASKLFRRKTIEQDYQSCVDAWERKVAQIADHNQQRRRQFDDAVAQFEVKQREFSEQQRLENDAIDQIKAHYEAKDPRAIEEYCDLVLSGSKYPDYFPQNWDLEYRDGNRMLIVEYQLPAPSRLPAIESYRYVKSRDEIVEKAISATRRRQQYDSVIYQVCIRTIHELFEADTIAVLDAIVFNGIVIDTNAATGIEETKLILSVSAPKDQFLTFDLRQVDPKATFKLLKGVAASTLVDLTPIPPIINLDKSDRRFVDSRQIADSLDAGLNIAEMHWEDFEHLIREIFAKEFSNNGGEVRVTQASADGGVDAIAFDPDPIRGGKIVIQAKRYTNVVGVAAVRDLYGTVMNEGAIKGILVTTSDYGRDSYEFAKDKPLTLLNGSNLLSLLEKHGYQARINIAEARQNRSNF